MKSSIKNMILSLLGITFVASASVAVIYQLTKDPIAQAKQAAVELSLQEVLPSFDQNTKVSLVVDELPVDIYTATKGGEVVGYAVQCSTKIGYSGLFTLMVGVNPDFEVLGVNVLSHSETPGLGSNMTVADNALISSIRGRSLETLDIRVRKDGGEVDALTGATITSRAYGDAVMRGFKALKDLLINEEGRDNE